MTAPPVSHASTRARVHRRLAIARAFRRPPLAAPHRDLRATTHRASDATPTSLIDAQPRSPCPRACPPCAHRRVSTSARETRDARSRATRRAHRDALRRSRERNGARYRIARWLRVYHPIDVVDPTRAFDGGIKGPAYEATNPQLKMPALTLADESMSLGESEVINQYLLT